MKTVDINITGVDLKILKIKRSWRGKSLVMIIDPDGNTHKLSEGDILTLTVNYSMDAKGIN